MKFTYIIGYRHTDDRLRNLKSVLKWLKNFDCEIIIVESDTTSKKELLTEFNFKHIFVENNYPYNRSWMYNVGYKNSSTNFLLFGDADLIMKNEDLNKSIDLLTNYDCVNPYSTVLDLTEEETLNYLSTENIEELSKIEREGRLGTNMCGGLVAFTKKGFEEIGGWHEDFWGWGAEDDFMTIKVKHFLKYTDCTNRCYHLNHGKAGIDRNLYYRNLGILQQSSSVSKESFRNYINNIVSSIGDTEKIKKMQLK